MKRLRNWVRRYLGTPQGRRWLEVAGATAAALACTFIYGAAQAAGGGEGHGGHGAPHLNLWTWDKHAPPIGWFAFNLVVFVGIIVYFARAKVVAMFQRRHDEVKAQIESGAIALQKAKANYEEYRDKLARVDQEVSSLIEGSKRDGAEERDRIVTQAESYSQRLRKDTGTVVEQETEAARRRLRQEIVDEVLREATLVLGKQLRPEDQARLLEESLKDLENGHERYAALEARSSV